MLATWSRFPLPSLLICSVVLSLTCSVTVGVIEKLGIGVVPYVVLLVVPVLGRMSDQCEDVRLMATYSFATLIRLMPLEVMIYVTPFSPQDCPCCSYLQLDERFDCTGVRTNQLKQWGVFYYMAESTSGRSDWPTQRARWVHLARSGIPASVPQGRKKKFSFLPYSNKSFIDQSFSTSSPSVKTQKKNLANIQLSWPHIWSITHIYHFFFF